MGDFKIIMVVMSGIQRLMKMIICHGMQCPFIHPAVVVSVNHLSHQPEFRFHLIGRSTQRPHKVEIQHICRIQANPIHIKLTDPEADYITNVLNYFRIFLIQLHQQIVAAPVIVGEAVIVLVVSPKIHITVPVSVF